MDYNVIEKKHKTLIDIAIKYENEIKDSEHDINHMYDVVENTKIILDRLEEKVNIEACIIGAYWHDVGRTIVQVGHEEMSTNMLKKEMIKLNYDNEFIVLCCEAIINHKWNKIPNTIEGWVVKDADKLGFISLGRWKSCIDNKQNLDSIMESLPNLKNKILHFDVSKEIYEEKIVELVRFLHNVIFK